MIETFLDESKLPSRTLEQKVFDGAVDYVFRNFPKWGREVNATLAALNSLAAGGVYAFPYLFDSSTADGDPGVGKLRLSSTTQNAATIVMRMDLQAFGGVDMTNVLADLRSSTSAVKGSVRLVKMADPSKWLVFDVTAVALPTGYRNLTMTWRATGGGLASPFTNGDALMVFIERNGDKGDLPLGGAVTCLVAESVSNVLAINYLNLFTSDYDRYLIEFSEFYGTTTANVFLRLAVGGVLQTGNVYSSSPVGHSTQVGFTANAIGLLASVTATNPPSPSVSVDLRNVNAVDSAKMGFVDAVNSNGGNTFQSSTGVVVANINSQVSGFQLFMGTGVSIVKGKLRVYGYRNQTGPGVF